MNKLQSIDFVITRWKLVHSLWLLSSMQGPVFVGCCYWFLGEGEKECWWNFPPPSKRHIPHPFFLVQYLCRTIVINPAWQFSVSLPPSFVSHKKSVLLLVLAHLILFCYSRFVQTDEWCIAIGHERSQGTAWAHHVSGNVCTKLHCPCMEHYGHGLNKGGPILSSPLILRCIEVCTSIQQCWWSTCGCSGRRR